MVAKIRKKQFYFLAPLTVILLSSILIFSGKVFSWGEQDRFIYLNDDRADGWNMEDSFEKEWFTNKNSVTFIVDLKEDLENWKSNNEGRTLPEGLPFEVTAKHGETKIDPNAITYTEMKNPEFEGRYLVTIPYAQDGRLDIKTSITEENPWGASPSEGVLHITRDHTAPDIQFSGVKDGELLKEDIMLNITVSEAHFADEKVTVFVKDLNSNKQTQVYPTWQQNEQDGSWKGSHPFTSSGEYEVTVHATDKAGNTGAAKSISFGINKRTPELTVTDLNNHVEIIHNGFSQSKKVQFKVYSGISIGEATVSIAKSGKESEAQQAALTVNKREAVLDYNFPEDGKYVIETTVKDQHLFGKEHTLSTFEFEVDSTSPVLTVTDGEGNPLKAEYSSEQEIKLIISDVHLDKEKVSLSGTRTGIDGQEENLEFVLDKTGNASLHADVDGVYKIRIIATDVAGNETNKNVEFTIDQAGPKVTQNIDKKYYQMKELILTVEDLTLNPINTLLKVTKVHSGISEDYTSKILAPIFQGLRALWYHEFTEEGDYTVEVSATDKLNQTIGQKEPISFTIDSTSPVLSIDNVVDGELYSTPLKGVEIAVHDKNIDLGQTKLTVKRDGELLEGLAALKVNGEQASNLYYFTEDGVYTIELESTDLAKNEAEAKTLSFTIDQTAPELHIENISNGGHYQEIKDVLVTALDLTLGEATLEIKKDGERIEFETLKGNLEKRLMKAMKNLEFIEEGDYEIILTAKDLTGRTSEEKISFTIDKTAPALQFGGISEGSFLKNGTLAMDIVEHNFETNHVKITATRKVDRAQEAEPYTEIAKWENSGEHSSLEHFFDQDGDYVVVVEAEDKAGNKATKAIQFTIDNAKPVIAISNANETGAYYNSNKEVSISINERNFEGNQVTIEATKKVEATDEKQPISIGVWNNLAEVSSLSHLFTEDGEYEIKVSAVDSAGNAADQQTVTFTVDKTAPVLSIMGVENQNHYNQDKPVEFKVTDRNVDLTGTSLTIRKDGNSYTAVDQLEQTGTTAQRNFIFTTEGSYVVNLTSTDKAGNTTEHAPIAFIIDKTNPVLKIGGVEDQSFNPAGKSVSVSVDELNFETNHVELTATKDGKPFHIGNWKNTAKLSALQYDFNQDGFYNILITARDKAGNGPIKAAKSFTVDKVKPSIDISGVDNGQHYNVDKRVTTTIKDVNLDVNKITVTKDGASYHAGNFSVVHRPYEDSVATLSHNFSAEGDYVVVVEATDKAGNNFSSQVSFTIDKTKPVITPKFKGENRTIQNGEYINKVFTPVFALDEQEDTIVSVTLNNGENNRNAIPVASKEMVYHYKVLATDKAGNEAVLEISFTLDTTKPLLNITGVLDGFFNKNITPKVTFSDTHLDQNRTSVTLNGQPFVNGTKLETERDYVLKATITDLANNVSSRTIVFTIDKTKPMIKFKEAISNKYFKEDLLPNLLIEDLSAYDIISQTLDGEPYNIGDPIKGEGKHVLFFEVKDKAGNIQQLSVEFIIDKTAPKVIFDGVEEAGKYYDPVSIMIRLDNPNDVLKTVTINGELFEGEIVTENGYQVIKTTLSDRKAYNIKVTAYDEAGNETNEVIPFEIVEKSLLVKIYENKPLLAGTIAGLFGIAGGLTAMVRRRKEKVEE